jgi:hypothetical protein
MSIKINWESLPPLPPKTILHCHFAWRWSANDFETMAAKVYQLHIEQMPQPIYTILNLTASRQYPRYGLLPLFAKLLELAPKNRKHIYIVGADTALLAFDPIFRRAYPEWQSLTTHTKTVEDTYALIQPSQPREA